ncbi:MAG: hypothetical protein DMG38_21015 [Acidobacteria bacterium]|nr:MAG: hypothetical protein DMG38_21015 [Acidobacteriota bacterium]
MAQYVPPSNEMEFAHADTKPTSPWKPIFRIVRWSTYAAAILTLILALHKTPPPLVKTSPQAAARAEQKFDEAERAVANGQPTTLRVDQTELNSYLSSHLEVSGREAARAASAASRKDDSNDSAPTAQDVEQMRSNVRDFKIQLVDDRVKAYVLFEVHGKDMTLQLEGRLSAQNGYLILDPVSGQIGSLPIPQSALESAVRRLMESPENREKLRLPPQIADLRIENGEVVASYR